MIPDPSVLSFVTTSHRYVVDVVDLAEPEPALRPRWTRHVLGFVLDSDGYVTPVVLFEGGACTSAELERDWNLNIENLREDVGVADG